MTLQERVEQLIAQHGGLRAAARATQIDPGYLSRLRSGEKVRPLVVTLRRLGLRRVVGYELTVAIRVAAATRDELDASKPKGGRGSHG